MNENIEGSILNQKLKRFLIINWTNIFQKADPFSQGIALKIVSLSEPIMSFIIKLKIAFIFASY